MISTVIHAGGAMGGLRHGGQLYIYLFMWALSLRWAACGRFAATHWQACPHDAVGICIVIFISYVRIWHAGDLVSGVFLFGECSFHAPYPVAHRDILYVHVSHNL